MYSELIFGENDMNGTIIGITRFLISYVVPFLFTSCLGEVIIKDGLIKVKSKIIIICVEVIVWGIIISMCEDQYIIQINILAGIVIGISDVIFKKREEK